MSLSEMIIIRVTKEQKERLKAIALENGVHPTTFCRNAIGLVIMPKPGNSQESRALDRIMKKIKEERKSLYSGNRLPRKRRKKAKNNGESQNKSQA